MSLISLPFTLKRHGRIAEGQGGTPVAAWRVRTSPGQRAASLPPDRRRARIATTPAQTHERLYEPPGRHRLRRPRDRRGAAALRARRNAAVAGDSRRARLGRTAAWLAAAALAIAALDPLGVDVRGWFSDLWDALTSVGPGYLIAGWSFQTAQTTLTALGWYFILRAGFPDAPVLYRSVLAAYAAGVALNGFLPANIGTVVMLLMFVAIIPGANLPGVVGGMVVQKIFFTVAGAFVYVYLFLSVPGSFELQLNGPHDHPLLLAATLAGAVLLITILGRIFWRRLRGLWEKARQGGAILARPRDYAVRVALPSFGAWLAKLAVIAVFLAGYGIAVTFHTVMSVMGGNSIANTVSVTPGGVGVNQAANVAALGDVTDAATATAYSLGQQLAITAWNVVVALVVVTWAFGWSGGKVLVEQSYADAKVKVADQKEQRRARKRAAR